MIHLLFLQEFNNILPEWHCSATYCQNDTAQPHVARMTLLGHILPEWHCPTTCCQNDTAEGHWLGIWDFATSTIFSWSLTHWQPFFQTFRHIFTRKTFCYKGEVETAFKDVLALKLLDFYRT